MLFVEYVFEISNSVEVSVRGSMEVDGICEYKPRGLQEGRSGLLLPMRVLTLCLPTPFLSLLIHTSFLQNLSPSYIISALTVVMNLNFMSWTIEEEEECFLGPGCMFIVDSQESTLHPY